MRTTSRASRVSALRTLMTGISEALLTLRSGMRRGPDALLLVLIYVTLLLPTPGIGQIPTDEEVQQFCQENDATACNDLMRHQTRLWALAGIGPVSVVAVGDDLPELSTDAVVTLVRDRLEAAGVELMPQGPAGELGRVFMDTGLQLLRTRIRSFPRGSDSAELLIELDFSEVAEVRRTGHQARSETWHEFFRVPAPPGDLSSSEAARGLLESLVDRFIDDFTAANPRGRPR